ncbi:MAG: MBL fold metallo-hydrolase [Burkholderiaceae bacterium]
MKLVNLVILMILSLLPFHVLQAQGVDSQPEMRVVLLGTGGPELTPNRLGYATLIEAGGQKLLFDAGRGVLQRLYESRVNVTEVTKVFITHLHNDHIEGLPSLWMTPWFLLGRDKPMEAWGPDGTAAMIKGMQAMFRHDMEHRVNKFNKLDNLQFTVSEIKDGEIYNRGGVKVTAFSVWHDDGNPAFGYRVDYKGRSVVLSGDTTYSENVVKVGRGADLIVHNVIAMSETLTKAPEMGPVIGKLTTPEQAARVFTETKPRMAVFSHIVKKELPGRHGDELILQRVRRAGYKGPLEMGYDRMVVEIGTTVRVLQPTTTDSLPDVDRKAVYANQ